MKLRLLSALLIFFSVLMAAPVAYAAPGTDASAVLGGGKDKEKKEKTGKGDKDDEEKNASMKKRKTYNPKKHARTSSKMARQSSAAKQKQIMYRAGVRNFFHKVFNSKPGKTRNFRSSRSRSRWNKGH